MLSPLSDGPDRLRSHSSDMLWPAMPSDHGAMVLSMLYQLERSEYWSAERILEHQLQQFAAVLRHARQTVPFYRRRLRDYQPHGETFNYEDLRELPCVSRRDLQVFGQGFVSEADLARFGGTVLAHSSGSTGEPVTVHKTHVDRLMWEALTLREHRWHGRDPAAELAAIRITPDGVAAAPDGASFSSWGAPTEDVWVTGSLAVLSIDTDIGTQFEWLLRRDPHYLLTFPSNLAALLEQSRSDSHQLARLAQVRTVGETVTPALREQVQEQWGVPLVDLYSCNELGYLALQCPVSGQYHIMSETVLVEVLDENDQVCGPGAVGRVVVTSLHNFAMPLIRYELGDYAEQGEPCACGRGLPTLARILGRVRNLVTLPDGRRHWPLVGFARYRDIAPVSQYQLVQTARDNIEVRLVVERALSAAEEASMTRVIHEALGHPFQLNFSYIENEIPRGPGRKFEEFISLI